MFSIDERNISYIKIWKRVLIKTFDRRRVSGINMFEKFLEAFTISMGNYSMTLNVCRRYERVILDRSVVRRAYELRSES